MNSPLVTKVRLIPKYSVIEGREVRGVVLHDLAGSVDGSLAWWSRPDVPASAHYIVSRAGDVILCVPEEFAAWHVARADKFRPAWLDPAPPGTGLVSSVNACTIGIELELAPDAQDRSGYTEYQLDVAADLVADILTRYGLNWDRVVRHGDLQSDRSDPRFLDVEELRRRATDDLGSLLDEERVLIREARKIGLNSWEAVSALVNSEAHYRRLAEDVATELELIINDIRGVIARITGQ